MTALEKALLGHVDTLAEEGDRECAVAWVYLSTLAVWAEDHDLVGPRLRADGLSDRARHFKAKGTAVGWLRESIASLAAHPGTACLIDPRYTRYQHGTPSEETVLALLDWWVHEAPPLAYDVDEGPGTICGFEIGDLRQALLDERTQRRDGVVYTPRQVVDFQVRSVIESTRKAHPGEGITVLDPFCGTGHYLVRYAQLLWDDYTSQGLSPRFVFETLTGTISGCEMDPLSAAVARLRTVAVLADLAYSSGLTNSRRLDAVPRFTPQVAVGDTFLAGAVSADEYARSRPELALIQNLGVPNIAWEAPWIPLPTWTRSRALTRTSTSSWPTPPIWSR